MKSQSQKNSEEIIKIQGELKVIHEKITNIRDNHLAHLESKISTIYKLLWVAVTISLSGLINYVAKSCDPTCPFDIVIVDKNGKIQLLDIKTITYRKRAKGKILKNKPKGSYKIHRTPTREQKRLGIRLLMINYED